MMESQVAGRRSRITVNGEPRDVPEGTTAAGLLEELRLAPERVVVEVNLTILKRAQLPETVLQEGDQVEIVHFVGGGAHG
jgi:thiazole synthase